MNIINKITYRLRRWRLAQMKMQLEDAEHEYWHWIDPLRWPGTPPSIGAQARKRIRRLKAKVAALEIKTSICMCDTEEEGWRPCPEELCERIDHADRHLNSEDDLGWHVIPGELLLESLRRVEKGEKAALVYTELWANSEREQHSAN